MTEVYYCKSVSNIALLYITKGYYIWSVDSKSKELLNCILIKSNDNYIKLFEIEE